MQTLNFIYNDEQVDFLAGERQNVMVNATQMAKIFGTDVFQFTRIEDTKRFIQACLKPQNCGLLGIKTEEDLIVSRQKSGTWMHRVLALKFAAWLDSDFEVWVFSTIDEIIYGHYKDHRDATLEKLHVKEELARKKTELLRENPELHDFFVLQQRADQADRRRTTALRKATAQLELLFGEEKK